MEAVKIEKPILLGKMLLILLSSMLFALLLSLLSVGELTYFGKINLDDANLSIK